MKDKLHYIVLAFLGFVVFGYSQETEVEEPVYDWVWAHNGGGDKDMGDSPLGNTGDWRGRYNERTMNYEQVVDIQVDADNNSYILAIIGEQNTRFGEEEVAVYNYTNRVAASSDVLLISLDCDGRTRWMRVVGGYGLDKAYSLGLDAQGGLYVGMTLDNRGSHFAQEEDPNYWVERLPPYFDEDTHLPYLDFFNNIEKETIHEGAKSLALVKYRTVDGSLDWVQYPEDLTSLYRPGAIEDFIENGTPYFPNLMGTANKVITEADGTTHWLVAFRPGSYLNGSIVVPENDAYWMYHEFHVLVYYGNGTLKRSFKVPLTTNETTYGGIIFEKLDFHNFWYDAVKQQYYLGGYFFSPADISPPPSFGGTPFVDGGYVLAFDPNGNELWRTTTDENLIATVNDIKTDEVGNIYTTGLIFRLGSALGGYFGNYFVATTSGIPYVFKLTPDTGSVSWGSFGTQVAGVGGGVNSSQSFGERLSVSANEVVLSMRLGSCNWGDFESSIPWGDRENPFIVRLSKATGVATGLYRIDAGKTTPSVMQAAAVDNDGNIIAGGFHSVPLFADHAVVSPLEVQGHGYVDFFVAKLAATECGTPVVFLEEEDGGLSTDKQHRGKAVIYPNPTDDWVYWESDIDWRYVEVYDVLGKTVLKANVQEASISLGHLTSGTYILALFDYKGNKTMEKLVLRR